MSSGTAKATVRTDQLSQSTAFYSYLAHQPLTTDETSAHLSVGEDLNDSSTVDGSVRAEETLRLHAARVQHVRESLQRADDLTKRMTGIFDSFEDRLKSLVEEIDPMHKKTTELKYKHENIKTTLVLMSKYLKMFDLPFDLREAIHQGPGSDIRAYVGKLDEVQNAVDFFQKHSNFRGSDKTIQHLRSIQEEGLERCHDAFCEILKSNSIPIPDLTKVDIIETIPEDVQETLKDLTKCLSRGQDEKWLQAYCEIRSDFLCNTLDKVTPDRMLREEVSQGGRYKKGSHKLISLNGMFLKLLQTERTLAMNLIPHSQCASTYFETITKAIETFIEAADGIVRQKRPEKMFIVLDIIENLEESLASYKNLLKVSGRDYDQGDILRFVVELKNTTKKNIEEYVEEVESHNIKAIPADGGTHAISSNTLNYAKRLLEYQKVVVGLLDGASAASKVLKAYILRVFNALIENLEHKAKQYSSTKTSYIFLLNNFHHISKFVSDSELLSFVGQDFLATVEAHFQKYRKAFIDYSWTKAYENITVVPKAGKPPKMDKNHLKARFATFNNELEDMRKSYQHYSILDKDLRQQLRKDVEDLIMPAYTAFYSKYGIEPFCKNMHKYVKYTPDTVRDIIAVFFEENAN